MKNTFENHLIRIFLGKIFGSSLKISLLLTNKVLTLVAKSSLLSLGLIAVTSAIDAGIQRKVFEQEATA